MITNLLTFPPSFILIQLFRRSERRTSSKSQKLKHSVQLMAIKSKLNYDDASSSPKVDMRTKFVKYKNKKLTFAWWMKIVAYTLSCVIMLVSALFIIIKGIEFGEEKVLKWLTSLVMSIISSVFLTQPIKVMRLTHF